MPEHIDISSLWGVATGGIAPDVPAVRSVRRRAGDRASQAGVGA